MTEEIKKYPNGKHPNSLANLRPQVKGGVARNPHGRPKNRLCLTAIARKKLDEKCPYAPDKTWAEYLVDRWFGQAIENPVYFRELLERMEGKVTQPVEAGGVVTLRVVYDTGDKGSNNPSA
jgi:hypothetical protein